MVSIYRYHTKQRRKGERFNNAIPKDDFSFPHIDALVDNTVSHVMLSFMGRFSGYNQIKMEAED